MKAGIAVHGGAGTMPKESLTPEIATLCKAALNDALEAGAKILEKDGSSLEAVEAAVVVLENFELFNAGKGSVFTHQGKHEMDASMMSGKDLSCGAVAGVRNIKNPIKLAKKILLYSDHILLLNDGAEEFARLHNIEFAEDKYFFSQLRYDQFLEAKKNEVVVLDHIGNKLEDKLLTQKKFGTVGAVALDTNGNLSAATSTGGMTNKLFGRVGDSPIIGAGTYANNHTCAISCTGHGEYFIQHVVAYQVHCLMEYKNMSLKEAAEFVIHHTLKTAGGEGGLIGIDKNGTIVLPFNTGGMYRGYKSIHEDTFSAIY